MDGGSEKERKAAGKKREQLVQIKSGDRCAFALSFLHITTLHLFQGVFCAFSVTVSCSRL